MSGREIQPGWRRNPLRITHLRIIHLIIIFLLILRTIFLLLELTVYYHIFLYLFSLQQLLITSRRLLHANYSMKITPEGFHLVIYSPDRSGFPVFLSLKGGSLQVLLSSSRLTRRELERIRMQPSRVSAETGSFKRTYAKKIALTGSRREIMLAFWALTCMSPVK